MIVLQKANGLARRPCIDLLHFFVPELLEPVLCELGLDLT